MNDDFLSKLRQRIEDPPSEYPSFVRGFITRHKANNTAAMRRSQQGALEAGADLDIARLTSYRRITDAVRGAAEAEERARFHENLQNMPPEVQEVVIAQEIRLKRKLLQLAQLSATTQRLMNASLGNQSVLIPAEIVAQIETDTDDLSATDPPDIGEGEIKKIALRIATKAAALTPAEGEKLITQSVGEMRRSLPELVLQEVERSVREYQAMLA